VVPRAETVTTPAIEALPCTAMISGAEPTISSVPAGPITRPSTAHTRGDAAEVANVPIGVPVFASIPVAGSNVNAPSSSTGSVCTGSPVHGSKFDGCTTTHRAPASAVGVRRRVELTCTNKEQDGDRTTHGQTSWSKRRAFDGDHDFTRLVVETINPGDE
jgi:hypothetical protein